MRLILRLTRSCEVLSACLHEMCPISANGQIASGRCGVSLKFYTEPSESRRFVDAVQKNKANAQSTVASRPSKCPKSCITWGGAACLGIHPIQEEKKARTGFHQPAEAKKIPC